MRAEAAGQREAGEQRAQGSPQAFSQAVWPTQPEHAGLVSPADQGGQHRGLGMASSATMTWMARLGDFLRTHVPGGVETRTTMTRLVQQEQVHTTSQAASPQRHQQSYGRPLQASSRETVIATSQEVDPPLFGAGARRVMDSWAQSSVAAWSYASSNCSGHGCRLNWINPSGSGSGRSSTSGARSARGTAAILGATTRGESPFADGDEDQSWSSRAA